MKWKKVSDHPLPPDTYKTRRFLIKLLDGKIYFTDTPSLYNPMYNLDGVEWCEFNPDEIESADKTESAIQHGHEPIEFQGSGDPSWEEKFRWETARDILCAELSNPNGVTQTEGHLKNVVCSTDKIIAELKRGRE